MDRLSSPAHQLQDHYEVVVVGSGYGGGIAASRLARAGRQVCVLERGKEFQPGEYPDTPGEAAEEVQLDFPIGHFGSRTGLYEIRAGDDIAVVQGCGLGGTSLINANVSIQADDRVFEDPRWPRELRDDTGLLEEGYRRAREMLKPTPLPDHVQLKKAEALALSAASMDAPSYRLPINVTFEDHVNHVGVEQHACRLCGDCVSGCNYGAKNTLIMNYLPDARNHGAQLFTRVSVRYLERNDDGWLVHYQPLDTGRERFGAPPLFLSADIVVVAAGSLGSTEILLRSRQHGLALSPLVGERFTGNGDVLAFTYNGDQEIHGVGWGQREEEHEVGPVGPTITSVVDLRHRPSIDDGTIIEEGAIPGALGPALPFAMSIAARGLGRDSDQGLEDYVKETARELESIVRGPYTGAVDNTQTYLVMGHDSGKGCMDLDDDDRLRVRWPGVGEEPIFQRIQDDLVAATKPLGGSYVKNPVWTKVLHNRLVTVHPLGGCVSGDDATQGVVNHKGQVFAGAEGTEVHDGLYVCDGAVVPRPLGVNPLLTISALAERAVALLAADRGWSIDYSLPSTPPPAGPEPAVGIQFSETMHGHVSTTVTDDFEAAARQGEAEGSPFVFNLTIVTEDLDRLIADPYYEAVMRGTVEAPALSPDTLTATGWFNLIVDDPNEVGLRKMRYRMKLLTEEGRAYWFVGFKDIRDDKGLDLWPDTTTQYVTVHDGDSEDAPVLARGVLRLGPADFVTLLSTIRVLNAKDTRGRLEATARFGKLFAGKLFDTFGGVLSGPDRFNVEAPPRKKRPLRVSPPELHPFSTTDGVQLLLTRYRGGAKGPVLLCHGLGVSSRIFSIDTIETNLLEYLHAHGYDVWLLDYRASIELPASTTRFTGDDVANKDYPAAVARVLELTGAQSVQAVVHCFGACTFFMAMLAGLRGVRSVVCSQVATHVVTPAMTWLKTHLYLPELLDALGTESLTAYTDTRADHANRLFDKLLDLYPLAPEERCESAVCHRITFLYSLLYEHDQLNRATHDVLHEMFGVSNISSFKHLARMARKGRVVTADGTDAYVPHLDRLALPITFIHGAENACYKPKSTEITHNLLSKRNGRGLYQRYVIQNYGHIDCIFGKDAARDVFPLMLKHLEATNQAVAVP